MSERKLTTNLMEKLMSTIDDKYIEFNIEPEVSFKIKEKPDFGEMMFIINQTADSIINLNSTDLIVEAKRILFYANLLDSTSTFPVPKITKNDVTIFDLYKLQTWLNKINFESELRRIAPEYCNKLYEMECLINEKIEFHKQQNIHNTALVRKVDNIVTDVRLFLENIMNVVMNFTENLDGVDGEGVTSIIEVFKGMISDGQLNSKDVANFISENFINKKSDITKEDEYIIESANKEFANVLRDIEEVTELSKDNADSMKESYDNIINFNKQDKSDE